MNGTPRPDRRAFRQAWASPDLHFGAPFALLLVVLAVSPLAAIALSCYAIAAPSSLATICATLFALVSLSTWAQLGISVAVRRRHRRIT